MSPTLQAPQSAAAVPVDRDALTARILNKLAYSMGTTPKDASLFEWRTALSLALRDDAVDVWTASLEAQRQAKSKRVYYLSMEFLIGRLIEDVAINMQVEEEARAAITALGQDYDTLVANEPDAALGNGGLGRLAACFMESLATLDMPAMGYGIRYEHGLFKQRFEHGRQVESAEDWLNQRHAWEFERPHASYAIGFGGHVSDSGQGRVWQPSERVIAVAYDTPIVGWQGRWANTLRLWSAKPETLFDLHTFNRGDYLGASHSEALARAISRVLYPDDSTDAGKELRLRQEYFFTAASIQDAIRRLLREGHRIEDLDQFAAMQLNDTHPAIAGPELIRLLEDEHGLPFEQAAELARKTLGYTNHTLLPEALERWPVDLFARILPRHLEIIQAIQNLHFQTTGSFECIIEHGSVKMGELAFIMAHKVNGVSALHSELVKKTVFANLHKVYPDRIINQTNGVTPRRWLYACNPPLRAAIDGALGGDWPGHLERLEGLAPLAQDSGFQDQVRAAKAQNKARLAAWIKSRDGIALNPDALFDVQVKRIHEYKRQLLNILETIAFWNDLKDRPSLEAPARVKVFGGKAAPGYHVAKEIIHLINDVAKTLNADPATRDRLQVAFPPNYNVTMAEQVMPAADLSEQISTAGKEASGTGNMKFALNGALTIGTLDGANVEIREHVGADNFFLFGLTAEQVVERRQQPDFSRNAIQASPRLVRVLDQIANGAFSPADRHRHAGIVHRLYEHDYFLVSCDFDAYYEAQRQVDAAYCDQQGWTAKAILNIARMGWFSSDRTIRGYAKDVWGLEPVALRRDQAA